ncbi:MAG: hypothetical protein EOO13_03055 [Chitinophagaceae bacterium]|nr:MAG: hypothetical protein EOO13_03055 [Chitinophagaceae bacterium]
MLKIRPETLVIILFNIIPIVGVAWYDWAPFQMFWLFWMETLIIAFFNCIRILFSQGLAAQSSSTGLPLRLNYGKALSYLVIRIFIFLFYSLFIIVFIGVMGHSGKNSLGSLSVIYFGNRLFNIALLLTVVTQSFYLVKYFFMNSAYYWSSPHQYSSLFDGRQIVIHIAVVLGGVGMSFLFKDGNSNWGAIWIISVFCVLKCVFELYFAPVYSDADSPQAEGPPNIFNKRVKRL